MKKIFFLAALLCTSLMASAYTTAPDTWIGGAGVDQYKWFEIDGVSAPADVVNIQKPGWSEETGIYAHNSGYNKVTFNGVEKENGVHYHQDGAGVIIFLSALTEKNTNVLFYNGENVAWGLRVYNDKGTEPGEAKTDPALSLNETAVTLSAEAPAETFQIVPTQSGDGAITYESSNAGIASVSDAGLVTAVGRGTATISVKTAETDTYAAATKKLTVTVTGPINWDAVAWLSGSNNKYKLVSDPEIADNFGGKKIEGSNLWIGFPSAVWGDNSSVEHTAVGAGVSFPLSQFPNKYNDFNFICDGVTYHITLYWADGAETSTAIGNVEASKKAYKVVEDGVVYIIRDGVKYNVLGVKF